MTIGVCNLIYLKVATTSVHTIYSAISKSENNYTRISPVQSIAYTFNSAGKPAFTGRTVKLCVTCTIHVNSGYFTIRGVCITNTASKEDNLITRI